MPNDSDECWFLTLNEEEHAILLRMRQMQLDMMNEYLKISEEKRRQIESVHGEGCGLESALSNLDQLSHAIRVIVEHSYPLPKDLSLSFSKIIVHEKA